MTILDDLAAELPAPRDDEPRELRKRIVAELRDHLQCAYQRELLRTGNETEATRRMLITFGKPARLARKLWFEAMQEKIMSQRIVVAVSAVLAFACLGMGGLALRIAQQVAAQSAEATCALIDKTYEANRLLLEQSREMNAALIDRLGRHDTDSFKAPERTRFKIRLVQGTADGPPVAGYRVFLGARKSKDLMKGDLNDYSGADGTVDCGLLLSGSYWISVTTASGIGMQAEIYIRLQESEQTETVICPVDDGIPERQVAIDVKWPEDLRKRRLGVLCSYISPSEQIGGRLWQCGRGYDGHQDSANSDQMTAHVGGILVATDGSVARSGEMSMSFAGAGTSGKMTRANGLDKLERLPESRLRLKGKMHAWNVVGIVFPSDDRTGEFGHTCPFVQANEKAVDHDLADTGVTTISIFLSDELLIAVRAALRELDPAVGSTD